MPQAKTRNEMKEARAILKPVLKAEKRMKKAANALVVAKLALAHALVEANVSSNAMLSAWTEAVLSGNEAAAQKVCAALTLKKGIEKTTPVRSSTASKVIPVKAAPAKIPSTLASKPAAPKRRRTTSADLKPVPL